MEKNTSTITTKDGTLLYWEEDVQEIGPNSLDPTFSVKGHRRYFVNGKEVAFWNYGIVDGIEKMELGAFIVL